MDFNFIEFLGYMATFFVAASFYLNLLCIYAL